VIRDKVGAADELTLRRAAADMIRDAAEVRGICRVEVFGPDGELKDFREVENLIVSAGRDAIIERLDSSPTTAQPSHMAVGTGAVAPAAGNTTLGAEIATTGRQALASSTSSGGVLTMVANWAAGQATNAAITEAGVLNAASAGTLYSRATFTAIAKAAADTLQITWTYTLTPT